MRFQASEYEYDKIVQDIFNLLLHYEGVDELTDTQANQYTALLDAYDRLTCLYRGIGVRRVTSNE